MTITGGSFNINDGIFEVREDGSMYATNAYILGGGLNINDRFIVDSDGSMHATDAYITGGGLNINNDRFIVNSDGSVYASALSITASADSNIDLINIGNNQFRIDRNGTIFSKQLLSDTIYVNDISKCNFNVWDEQCNVVNNCIKNQNHVYVETLAKYYVKLPENIKITVSFYDNSQPIGQRIGNPVELSDDDTLKFPEIL